MTDQTAGIDETRLNVFLFQPGITLQQDLGRVSRGEHPEDMLDGQPPPANNWLAAKDVRIHGNTFEKLYFVHLRPRSFQPGLASIRLPPPLSPRKVRPTCRPRSA